MKVFISSVRRGLEVERDSLPGLILALGQEPKRFEDFGAQTVPSREACLRGVNDSDAYLLLLGPNYGHVFPETGQSATHDEWMAAITKGMPKLVFRKRGVEFEPEQERFAKLVGDYGHGGFYAEFNDVADLQTQVVRALRELEAQPLGLTFSALHDPIEVVWYVEDQQNRFGGVSPAYVELHVVPLRAEPRSARQLRELPGQLVSSLRSAGAVAITAGVDPVIEDNAVTVELPVQGSGRWGEARDGALAGVRVSAGGQVSLRWSLPSDGLGSILDRDALTSTVAGGLRLIGALRVVPNSDVAIGIGIGGDTQMLAEGKVTGVPRTSGSMSISRSEPIRVEPDEAVSAAAFDRGANEVASSLVQTLVHVFQARR